MFPVIRSVHLGDNRRHYGWSGGHLNDLHGCAMFLAHFDQLLTHGARDLMTGSIAVFFVNEIDLNIAEVTSLPQVLLSDQPIEIDRGGRANIDLVVGNLLYALDYLRQSVKGPGSGFQAGAFGHVDQDLDL